MWSDEKLTEQEREGKSGINFSSCLAFDDTLPRTRKEWLVREKNERRKKFNKNKKKIREFELIYLHQIRSWARTPFMSNSFRTFASYRTSLSLSLSLPPPSPSLSLSLSPCFPFPTMHQQQQHRKPKKHVSKHHAYEKRVECIRSTTKWKLSYAGKGLSSALSIFLSLSSLWDETWLCDKIHPTKREIYEILFNITYSSLLTKYNLRSFFIVAVLSLGVPFSLSHTQTLSVFWVKLVRNFYTSLTHTHIQTSVKLFLRKESEKTRETERKYVQCWSGVRKTAKFKHTRSQTSNHQHSTKSMFEYVCSEYSLRSAFDLNVSIWAFCVCVCMLKEKVSKSWQVEQGVVCVCVFDDESCHMCNSRRPMSYQISLLSHRLFAFQCWKQIA